MEKERYEELLRNLEKINDKLDFIINDLDSLKKSIVNSIVIGGKIIYKEDIDKIAEQTYNNKNKLNNVIIPTIKNKLNELSI